MRLLLMLLALVAPLGCKKKSDAPDCKAAASAYASLVKDQIDRDNRNDESRRAQALSLIPSLKEEMTRACEKDKWSDEMRTCIRAAKAAEDLPRCMPKKAGAEPAAPAAPAAEPAAPAAEPAEPAAEPAEDSKSGE